MKRLLFIVLFCVLVPSAYGETINYDNGDKYVGEVSNGVPHGHGTYFYAHGDKYIGEYKDGLQHGHGTYIYATGDKYIGEWKDDLEHGHGTYIWANGAKYIGEYKDNIEWNGVYYNADGTVRGTYSNGEWIAK